jgi:fermentation-respiration switch protein FrsA (DUF1100 family)
MDYEVVSFLTADSIAIRGWFIESTESRNGILLVHGFAVDKSDVLDIAQLLYQSGYSVLLFDLRAHGESEGVKCSLGYYEREDLNAAVGFLQNRGITKIGAMGFSMGGTAALFCASENGSISAIVSDSGYLSFRSAVRDFAACYYHIPEFPFIPPVVWFAGKRLGFDPKELDLSHHLSSIAPRPLLIIHTEDDREISVENAHALFAYAKDPKALWIVETGGHLGAHATHPTEYEHRLLSFFNDALSSTP